MPELKLNLFVLQTRSVQTIAIADGSTYSDSVTEPTIKITPPGKDPVTLPFTPTAYNVFNSSNLGLSVPFQEDNLPDGIYTLLYSFAPAHLNFIEKSFMRIDRLQEKFDSAFMTLDMMECDMTIKAQSKKELDTIYYLIQGSVAAANNCDILVAKKLYKQADKMLDKFVRGGCGCNGTYKI